MNLQQKRGSKRKKKYSTWPGKFLRIWSRKWKASVLPNCLHCSWTRRRLWIARLAAASPSTDAPLFKKNRIFFWGEGGGGGGGVCTQASCWCPCKLPPTLFTFVKNVWPSKKPLVISIGSWAVHEGLQNQEKKSLKQAPIKQPDTTIIVKSVWKVAVFTSFFPSFPCPWPNVEQNLNVCGRNCSVISQHWIGETGDI